MKRIIALALAALLLLPALAACGGAPAKEKEPGQPVGEGPVSLANPWSDVEDAAAAAEGAGVGYFELPEDGTETGGGPLNWFGFRCMKGVAEANGAIGAAELTVRKGLKQDGEDVSGDYTAFKFEWTQELDGASVKCFGNEDGRTMKAIWTSDNFSYCLLVRGQGDLRDTYGLDAETVVALAGAIQ